ncbi:DUF3048 domain-containing protein [Brassicibacter mesophilus]|uniref:DUF3048 domain-containing protein n=1 Tax=Brassicibacter mesophilus TaxID=745119 RepID=UPI003D24D1B2
MSKKYSILLAFILIIVMSITACSNKENKGEIPADNIVDNETKSEDDIGDESTGIEENEIKDGVISPFSGIIVEKSKVERRPVAIMFDNHPRARWQSGLSQAEIVYEFLVEAPYTRYMGVFLVNEPELIGPVRSARPYFITTLLEYDPIYVRCGGSEAAKADVKKYKIADIDGLYSGAFWRYKKTGKKEPNNLYTSMEAIRKEQNRLKYKQDSNFKVLKFNESDLDIEGAKAENIVINYNSDNTTKYVYDSEAKVYNRYKDGKLHVDEFDETQIIAKNIIIQEAKTKLLDSEGRLDIQLVGKGKGMYITNGKAKNITWSKESINSKTIYYDETGEELKLNPGVTWIQVTRISPSIEIK